MDFESSVAAMRFLCGNETDWLVLFYNITGLRNFYLLSLSLNVSCTLNQYKFKVQETLIFFEVKNTGNNARSVSTEGLVHTTLVNKKRMTFNSIKLILQLYNCKIIVPV